MKAYEILSWMVKHWSRRVGGWLNLESYLLSKDDRTPENNNEANPPQVQPNNAAQINAPNDGVQRQGLAARHQAFLALRPDQNVEEYQRPDHFALRLVVLISCLAITLIGLSTMALVIPGELLVGSNCFNFIFSCNRSLAFESGWSEFHLNSR